MKRLLNFSGRSTTSVRPDNVLYKMIIYVTDVDREREREMVAQKCYISSTLHLYDSSAIAFLFDSLANHVFS